VKQAHLSHLSIVAAVIVMLSLNTLTGRASVALAAPGTDVCAESNGSYETACFLGPKSDVFGFLSDDSDVDMYRIEPLEFGVMLHLELTQQPFPYRLAIFNWEGKVLTETHAGDAPALDVHLGPPGCYYVVVSKLWQGQFSATAPYRLASQLTYPGTVPTVAYSATFRPDGKEADDFDVSSDEDADIEIGRGSLKIKMKEGGTAKDPNYVGYWLPIDATSDFTLSLDVRLITDSNSGYDIMFRSPEDADDETGYHLLVDPRERRFQLRAVNVEDDEFRSLGKWQTSDAINADGPNRIVVRAKGDDIRVNINGTEVAHVKDSTFSTGHISFEALAWSKKPPVVNFSNILVTTN
jgi:hypothetical protein